MQKHAPSVNVKTRVSSVIVMEDYLLVFRAITGQRMLRYFRQVCLDLIQIVEILIQLIF
jgi:hypothetical protein